MLRPAAPCVALSACWLCWTELRLTNLVTTDLVAQPGNPFTSSAVEIKTDPEPAKLTKTTESTDGPASDETRLREE